MARNALIIGGPKDSGKSCGIEFMKLAAEKIGYNVFQLNLKGSVTSLKIQHVMEKFSWDVSNKVLALNDHVQLKCLYYEMFKCPGVQLSSKSLDYFWSIMQFITLPLLCSGIVFVMEKLTARVVGMAQNIRPLFRLWFIILLLIITLQSHEPVSQFTTLIRYKWSFSAYLIRDRIAAGDWSTTYCCLDAFKKCSDHEAILIVRDIKNFPPDNLHHFLNALHPLKEHDGRSYSQVRSPVLLETSDALWMKDMYTDTSNSAFRFYYMKPMTYSTGKSVMVDKFALFDEQHFKDLYKLFRGHIRFYTTVWPHIVNSVSYNGTLKQLVQESEMILSACFMHIRSKQWQKNIELLFYELKENNSSVLRYWLSNEELHLVECNLLFFNAETHHLSIQNSLLEKSVDHFLELAVSEKK